MNLGWRINDDYLNGVLGSDNEMRMKSLENGYPKMGYEKASSEKGKTSTNHHGFGANYNDVSRRVVTPNGGLVREIPGYFREIDRLVKYYSIWPDGFGVQPVVLSGVMFEALSILPIVWICS